MRLRFFFMCVYFGLPLYLGLIFSHFYMHTPIPYGIVVHLFVYDSKFHVRFDDILRNYIKVLLRRVKETNKLCYSFRRFMKFNFFTYTPRSQNNYLKGADYFLFAKKKN